jgi:hypothetical protein
VLRLGQSRPGRDARVDSVGLPVIPGGLATGGPLILPPERRDR